MERHMQMECDSMHSVIERALRHKRINVPADYAYVAKKACKKNPYEAEYLYHHFFKDFQIALPFYKSIRTGKRVDDLTVTNISALRYAPDGKIVYKLRHINTVWEEFQIKTKKICAIPWNIIPQLYSARLKIKRNTCICKP
ncbi:uncharacterized protein TNCV_2300301 [Trichonephila clavipes]|nr:uncharacterized protein TNCV_2300301 [Trichonephila clavipes]